MAGVRIHHPTERNCTLLIKHPGEIRLGFRRINKGRKPKDYHIKLDNEGNCIVSDVVLARLKEANANFIVLNEVMSPPAQVLGFDQVEANPVYKRELEGVIRQIAPPGSTVTVRGQNG